MKEFVVVTWEEGPYHIEPLPKDIGGLTCKGLPMNMSGSVTSAKGMPRTSISQEEP